MKIELRGITKTFGRVVANNDIHLTIPAGSIQGILGENGAGKSTLMKVLSGFILADKGQILLDDQPVSIASPADAIRNGVGMLHQDPLDFPPMKVIDNFINGSQGALFPNHSAITKAFNELQNQFDFSLDPKAYVDTLTVGERQQLEILRLLWLGARVLILDEPTTGISTMQKTKLFSALRRLAEQGKSVIFVSHKLEDVEQLCSRVAVLRRGQLVGEAEPPFLIFDLVRMMFGKEVTMGERYEVEPGEPVLDLHNLVVEDYKMRITSPDLQICQGEVVGIAGMEGSGQQLFLRACSGLVRPVSGKINLNGKDLTGSNYHAFMQHGVAYVPASRMDEGLIQGLSLSEHFVLAEKQERVFIDWKSTQELASSRIEEYNIRGIPATLVEDLSGGNQQRALLALLRMPLSLILMEHPTRGLDVESSIYIWSKLKERCKQGTTILFISADLDEILQYSDRILVFFAGRVTAPLPAASTTLDQLGQYIGGKGL